MDTILRDVEDDVDTSVATNQEAFQNLLENSLTKPPSKVSSDSFNLEWGQVPHVQSMKHYFYPP
jgi:hypothetical protein